MDGGRIGGGEEGGVVLGCGEELGIGRGEGLLVGEAVLDELGEDGPVGTEVEQGGLADGVTGAVDELVGSPPVWL